MTFKRLALTLALSALAAGFYSSRRRRGDVGGASPDASRAARDLESASRSSGAASTRAATDDLLSQGEDRPAAPIDRGPIHFPTSADHPEPA